MLNLNQMKFAALLAILFLFVKCGSGQKEQSLDSIIPVFLDEIQTATKNYKDLWGIDLYGPMLFFD